MTQNECWVESVRHEGQDESPKANGRAKSTKTNDQWSSWVGLNQWSSWDDSRWIQAKLTPIEDKLSWPRPEVVEGQAKPVLVKSISKSAWVDGWYELTTVEGRAPLVELKVQLSQPRSKLKRKLDWADS